MLNRPCIQPFALRDRFATLREARVLALLALLMIAVPAKAQVVTPYTEPGGTHPIQNATSLGDLNALVGSINFGFSGHTAVSVTDPRFGAKCDGVTDDTAAVQRALNSVPINEWLTAPPNRTCLVNGALSGKANLLFVNLKWKTDLGAGRAGLTWNGRQIIASTFAGPNTTASCWQNSNPATVGVSPSQMDGVLNTDGAFLVLHTAICGFHAGWNENATNGHEDWARSALSANFYGIEIQNTGGDFIFEQGYVNGNTWGNIVCKATADCLNGAVIRDTHLGFAPYGIVQLAGKQTGGWIADATLDYVRFESIGNNAIVSHATNAQMINLKVLGPGYIPNRAQHGLTASVSTAGKTTDGSATISDLRTTTGIQTDMVVSDGGGHACVPQYDYVTAVNVNNGTVTLSRPTNGSGCGTGDNLRFGYNDGTATVDTPSLSGRLYIEQDSYPFTGAASGNAQNCIVHAQTGAGGKVTLVYKDAYKGPPSSFNTGRFNGEYICSESNAQMLYVSRVFSNIGSTFTVDVPNNSSAASFDWPWPDYYGSHYLVAVRGFAGWCVPQENPGGTWWTTASLSGATVRSTIHLGTANKSGGNIRFACTVSDNSY
jgi:hypothetical protein